MGLRLTCHVKKTYEGVRRCYKTQATHLIKIKMLQESLIVWMHVMRVPLLTKRAHNLLENVN